MQDALPAAGTRVKQTAPEYAGTKVHHSLYLPKNWFRGEQFPVMVEYAGNYSLLHGCTGEVGDAALGYGLSQGIDFIWVVFPFISNDHQTNQLTWWGDEKETVEYCRRNIYRICNEFGGDTSRIILCGFSRGSIAVNYIGLYDDDISKLWHAFITHDHYDGERLWANSYWGSPLEEYRKRAEARLNRLNGRPALVMQAQDPLLIYDYLKEKLHYAEFTFMVIPIKELFPEIPNEVFFNSHTDRWLLAETFYSRKAREWLKAHNK
ncbi:MAG TPA: hypothetical protein DCY35_12120 [Prolixibacteraceae bacterium]|nr:hypothetical protein [Prolixibacteraceae bacterium]